MSIYDSIRVELKELIQLVRLDEQYAAVVTHGRLKPDYRSKLSNQRRTLRIDELSRKYGIL